MTELIDWGALIEQVGDSLQPLPQNDYMCQVVDAQYKPANSGRPMWVVRFKVLDGPYAGRTLFNNYVLSKDNPNAMQFFFRHMNAFGADKNFFATQPTPNAIAEKIKTNGPGGSGAIVKLNVGTKMYNGETRNEVKNTFPAPPGYQPPAQTPGNLAASPAASPSAPAPAAAPTPGGIPAPAPTPQSMQGVPAPSGVPAPAPAPAPTPPAPQAAVPSPAPAAPAPSAAEQPVQQRPVESNSAPAPQAQQPAQEPAQPAPAPQPTAAAAAPPTATPAAPPEVPF
jgi:hypothetical protein